MKNTRRNFIKTLVVIFAMMASPTNWAQQPPQPTPDHFIVYSFLLEDCVISQNCTAAIRQLHGEYANNNVEFLGLFPNRFSTKRSIAKFKRKYQLPFKMRKDPKQALARKLGVKVTPEVAVWNVTKGELAYRGRIDDTYVALGKRRATATTSELRDALRAVTQGRLPEVQRTAAVGCFIEFE